MQSPLQQLTTIIPTLLPCTSNANELQSLLFLVPNAKGGHTLQTHCPLNLLPCVSSTRMLPDSSTMHKSGTYYCLSLTSCSASDQKTNS
ncbi:hypothetical protein Mapa_012801 [Marchantia paleacea]|nr:hypothetical protein Mapa_012801 [Marchantia paleacea]